MKFLKTFALFGVAILMVNCNEDHNAIEQNIVENQNLKLDSFKSFSEAVYAGFDVANYVNSLPSSTSKNSDLTPFIVPQNPNFETYYSQSDFFDATCNVLPMESFSNVNYYSGFPNYLDQYSNHGVFNQGDIRPNISFETTNLNYNSQFYGFWPWYDPQVDSYVELATNFDNEDIIIKFTSENVTNIGLKVSAISGGSTIAMQVYGKSGYLGSFSTSAEFWGPDRYLGAVVNEPITQVIINNIDDNALFSIDNVSFGSCNDLDGDGIDNEKDRYQYSNTSPMLNLDCYLNVENQMVKRGVWMNDEIQDAIDMVTALEGVSDRKRTNKFKRKMYIVVNYWWYKYKLISSREKREILECINQMSYPFNDNNAPI